MTYQQRKEQQACTRQPCTNEPDETGECALHQSQSRDRKRYWWTYRRNYRRPKQLCLVLGPD